MSDGITCYERDEELCVDPMCRRTGCRVRNERLTALAQPQNDGNEVFQDDLREMLRALGMFDGAQMKSPHEVFQSAIAEMKRQLSAQPQNDAEAIAWMMPEHIEAYRKGERDGIAWANHTKTDAYTVPLYTAPPSPELERMRKALEKAQLFIASVSDSSPSVQRRRDEIWTMIDKELSRASDNNASDGKESEGYTSVSVSREGIAKMMDAVENPKQPSENLKEIMREHRQPPDPTPAQERREEIARMIDPRAFIIVNSKREDIQNRQELALGTADRILALPPAPKGEPSQEIRWLISSARAFLRHFNPCNLAEDKSQQWQSLSHQCDVVERALRREPEGER